MSCVPQDGIAVRDGRDTPVTIPRIYQVQNPRPNSLDRVIPNGLRMGSLAPVFPGRAGRGVFQISQNLGFNSAILEIGHGVINRG